MNLEPGSRILRDRYRLVQMVSPGHPAAGHPAVWRVSDDASLSFAKIWRDDPGFLEVQSIWTHEVRSLLRLGGLPAADEVFVRLRELGVDPAGFVIVLDSEGREPLAPILVERQRHPWLADTRAPRGRRKLWQGLLRVARGLNMMHAEGTLHRTLSADSVFTDPDGACDFRLSGFEWSLRVATSEGGSPDRPPTAPELEQPAAQYSVATDWFSFGLLCAQVVSGLSPAGGGPEPLARMRKALDRSGITPAERRFIADLIDPNPERRTWRASDVTEAIGNLAEALSGNKGADKRPLYVAFDLSRNSTLAKQIDKVTGGEAPARSLDAQLRFVVEDLGPEPQVSTRLQPFPHYVLHGAKINYQLGRWARGPTDGWVAARCTQHDAHPAAPIAQTFRFPGRRIEARTSAWVAENIRSVRSTADPWDDTIPIRAARGALSVEQSRTVRFLQVTNQLEALLAIVQIWPVAVVDSGWLDDQPFVDVTPTVDEDRDRLARAMGLPGAAEQMQRLFQLDEVVGRRAAEQRFSIGGEGRLSGREAGKPVPWLFVDHRHHPDGPRYRFVQAEAADTPPSGRLFLRPMDLALSSLLLHRRKKAIEELAEHRALLDAIDDPSTVKRSTVEELGSSSNVEALDPSKRAALGEIWRSQPFYALQGPPGTGKTTLVATMAVEQVKASLSTQLLVTAQSGAVVDTVMGEVLDAFGGSDATVAVRLDSEGERGVGAVAARLAAGLEGSDFAKAAPPDIAARVRALRHGGGAAGAAERAGFERIVEEGATLTFATTNSGSLARLLDSGRRYDWSIIEEAARAHGFDLVLPLRASHRVLMIGDQQQLPAFNIKVFDELLRQPEVVLGALRYGNMYAPTLIERYALKQAMADKEAFAADCAAWRHLLRFFGAVFERCEAAGEEDGERIARRITHQHRMHPAIRRVVSDAFYPDLGDADGAEARFAPGSDPFEVVPGSWMPAAPIVFVDVPWLQRGRDARGEETRPRYTAPIETDAVLKVLAQFVRKSGEDMTGREWRKPTLQVLSPYRAQVRAVRKAVLAAAGGRLAGLGGFEVRGAEVGATVDEFQGNQADLVVVSLVRNNEAKPGAGVGFLADGERWNVLLSRAKRKMVLVGSWDFLRSRFSPDATTIPADDPMHDLAQVMEALRAAVVRANLGSGLQRRRHGPASGLSSQTDREAKRSRVLARLWPICRAARWG